MHIGERKDTIIQAMQPAFPEKSRIEIMNRKIISAAVAAICFAGPAQTQTARPVEQADIRAAAVESKYGDHGQSVSFALRLASGRDCTPEYFRLYPAAYEKFQELAQKTVKYKIILVPGYLTYYINGSRFDILKTWLGQIGADYITAPIDTAKTRLYNAVKIKEAVESAGKPCIIISHSKGGIDTLEALIKYPEIRAMVKGWISLQTPFAGSPLADKYIENSFVYNIFSQLISDVGGSPLSLDDLSTWERKQYHELFQSEIEQITRVIPIVALAAGMSPKTSLPYCCDSGEAALPETMTASSPPEAPFWKMRIMFCWTI